MAARIFFAWRMFAAAKAQDDREYNTKKEAKARACSKPLKQLTETQFKSRYRLTKQKFKELCRELRQLTNLRSSQRVSLEHKVCSCDGFGVTVYLPNFLVFIES